MLGHGTFFSLYLGMKYATRFKLFALVFVGIYFLSCDCVQRVKGVVVDKTTDKPIPNVLVRKQNGSGNEIKTDSIGGFELSAISVGLFGCSAMEISAFKPEYKIATATVPAGGEIKIELER